LGFRTIGGLSGGAAAGNLRPGPTCQLPSRTRSFPSPSPQVSLSLERVQGYITLNRTNQFVECGLPLAKVSQAHPDNSGYLGGILENHLSK
jgi:hypothetical protein